MGLKGGFNNFGIVTKFTLKTHEQTEVWGGPMQIAGEHFDALIAATVEFTDNVNDPKAQMMTTYSYSQGRVACALVLFYDGPTAPTGMFDAFLAIPSIQSNVKTRSFLDLIGATPTGPSYGFRGIFSGFNVLDSTASLLNFIIKEAEVRGKELAAKSGIVAAYAVTPFHSSIYSHNTQTTAFPPDRVTPYIPFNMYYSWLNATYDNDFYDTARASAQTITNAAIAEGQSISPNAAVYPNNAMFGTPLERIYGDNLPTLRALKRRVDPLNVMGLAGGFKF
ncbi:hypothetical protein NLJ89_g6521 [Agrocybe chaxingu]|uniref:Berberine/berberine-like domain-containing protein n=1 Tax=Agrocybe chaxingu TaxID=84603 RepID=A0A9W8K6A2_9AGAR|nr:hypothetical protein NLJ89_g6521 [Agrocybe chaxingu]